MRKKKVNKFPRKGPEHVVNLKGTGGKAVSLPSSFSPIPPEIKKNLDLEIFRVHERAMI